MSWIVIAVFFVIQTFVQLVGTVQPFDESPKGFCASVPNLSQIQNFNKCPSARLFTKPLRKMRECCDLGSDSAIKRCLSDLRTRELDVNNLFLKWKEPENRELEYMKNVEYCRQTYSKLQVQSRGCANKFDERCMDPVGYFEANCTGRDKNSVECKQGFLRAMRKGAMASFCTNNRTESYELYESETVHHRCFRTSALNLRYQPVMDDADKIEAFCLNEKYGAATDYKLLEKLKMYEGIPVLQNMLLDSSKGLYEALETQTEKFLPNLCKNLSPNKPRDCLETPVTQTFLTFKSKNKIENEVDICCNNHRSNVQRLKECLTGKDLYQQFYQLSGLFMRGLNRAKTGYISECVVEDTPESNAFQKLTAKIITNEYSHETDPVDLEKQFRDYKEITPINYHFFLREVAEKISMSDAYYKAACEACADGENWGKQSYVYPGLMCPALAAKKYYEPIIGMDTCPKMLFYKYQVAHYCCLDSAFETFNFGSSYDPTVCPDMSGVKEIKSQ